jgi:hypothetical protein
MSDEQRKEEAEVEAHRIKHLPASEEPGGELESDDEVEAHVRRHQKMKKD